MSTTTIIPAGNTARVTVTFAPDAGVVSLANVTARAFDPKTRTTTTLTPVQDATNVFHADVTVPDDAQGSTWVVRFESNTPSPKIAIEDRTTSFVVTASQLPAP